MVGDVTAKWHGGWIDRARIAVGTSADKESGRYTFWLVSQLLDCCDLTLNTTSEDALKVWRDYGISMRGCVELNTMVRNVDPEGFNSVPQNPIGLARLAEMYLKKHLRKDQHVRTSNWEEVMSQEQLTCES